MWVCVFVHLLFLSTLQALWVCVCSFDSWKAIKIQWRCLCWGCPGGAGGGREKLKKGVEQVSDTSLPSFAALAGVISVSLGVVVGWMSSNRF